MAPPSASHEEEVDARRPVLGSGSAHVDLPPLSDRRLSLFGSRLTGHADARSDVDFLVEFEPDAKPSLLTMAEIELELSPLLKGRRVDLRTAEDLGRYFRDAVVRTAEPQYEA